MIFTFIFHAGVRLELATDQMSLFDYAVKDLADGVGVNRASLGKIIGVAVAHISLGFANPLR